MLCAKNHKKRCAHPEDSLSFDSVTIKIANLEVCQPAGFSQVVPWHTTRGVQLSAQISRVDLYIIITP